MERIQMFFVENWKRIAAFALILILMVCSVTFLGKTFTNPQTYSDTIQSIDDKKMTVLGTSATIAATATALAIIPDDSTTPLASKLMELSGYLLLVVCVLVLEKSLLTVFGAVSCYVLFPIAGSLALAYIINKKKSILTWAFKLAVLALALLVIVPASAKISDYIYEVNQVKIEQQAEEAVQPTEAEAEAEPQQDTRPWYQKWWDGVTTAVDDVVDSISNAAKEAIKNGQDELNKFTDQVAIFVIAYCAIPIFVIFLLIWLLKILFGINIDVNPSKLWLKKSKKETTQDEKIPV